MLKHVPERMCACCRTQYPKDMLVRIVRDLSGCYFVDKTSKIAGRGAYICKNSECLKKLIKTRALNKSFKAAVPDEVYQAVLKEVEGIDDSK